MFKILLVDDDSAFLEMFYQMIDWDDYDFEVVGRFYNGRAAAKYLESNDVDAIITDIRMPEMSGVDLAKDVYNRHPKVKIMFFSAFCDFEYAAAAIDYGVVGYISKPVSYSGLGASLEKLRGILEQNSDKREEASGGLHDGWLDKAKEYVEKNYAKDIGVETVADVCNFNSEHFSRLFKKEMDMKFIDYLNSVRIDKAKELLVTHDGSIDKLYMELGYKSRGYFYKMFGRYAGMSPAEFRKQNKKG